MTARTPYTLEDDALIRRMAEDGCTTNEIAREMNRHPSSVGRRMDKLDLTRLRRLKARKWTPEMDAILERYADKETREQIAKRIGMTKGAVIGRMRRLGLTGLSPMAPKPWTQYEDDYLRENVGKMTQADIGRELGRESSSISIRLKKLGLRLDRAPTTYLTPRKAKAPEAVPLTARPWLTRTNRECKYLYGERHAYLACCAPVWMETGMCEHHAALCGGYRRVAA